MSIKITFCYSGKPRQVLERALEARKGESLMLAIQNSGVQQDWALDADLSAYHFGVWNERIKEPNTYIVQDGDRIEIYRELRVDPMVARRERFQKQGARSAGLFAKRRPGAKPGY